MTLLYLFLFLFGAIIGSFLNLLIYRLPRGKNIVSPRSSCPHCSRIVEWYCNIPVLSYLTLRGKCRHCEGKIPLRYVGIELFSALATVYFFPVELLPGELLSFLFRTIVLYTFIAIFFIDIDFKIIPNILNLYLGTVLLLFASLHTYFAEMALGFILGGGFPLLITWIFYLLRGEIGLGGGDIKLFAALGIYLGPLGIIKTILLSGFFGSIFVLFFIMLKKMDKKTKIPFGPFIVLVASWQIFFPDSYARLMP